jgi:hypothetical protein
MKQAFSTIKLYNYTLIDYQGNLQNGTMRLEKHKYTYYLTWRWKIEKNAGYQLDLEVRIHKPYVAEQRYQIYKRFSTNDFENVLKSIVSYSDTPPTVGNATVGYINLTSNGGTIISRVGTASNTANPTYGISPAAVIAIQALISSINPYSGSGTSDRIVKWTGATAFGNSNISDDGQFISFLSNTYFTQNVNMVGTVSIGGTLSTAGINNNSFRITNVASAINSQDAVNLSQMTAAISAATSSHDPLTQVLSIGNSTGTFSIDMNGNNIINVASGSNNLDAVNYGQLNSATASIYSAISAIVATGTVSYYHNVNTVPFTVGGIPSGDSFSGTYSLQQMFDFLLYPYVAPGASIAGLSVRQYGAAIGVSLNWSATRHTNPIISIIVDSVPQTPTGNSQTGVQSSNGTYSTTPPIITTNTFNMSDSDGTATTNTSTTLSWENKRYWGNIDLSSIGNPNLTINPGSASSVGSFISNSNIITLTGAGVGSGNELSTTRAKTYTGINGSGLYLIFAWPTAFGTPAFTVNNLPNTAYTKVKSNFVFTNELGFSGTNYDVWVSNTLQNSPLNIVVS